MTVLPSSLSLPLPNWRRAQHRHGIPLADWLNALTLPLRLPARALAPKLASVTELLLDAWEQSRVWYLTSVIVCAGALEVLPFFILDSNPAGQIALWIVVGLAMPALWLSLSLQRILLQQQLILNRLSATNQAGRPPLV
jgi:hypothetical protein